MITVLTGCAVVSDSVLPDDASGAQKAMAYTMETALWWRLWMVLR